MAIKYTFQGILIYATMTAYLLALLMTLLRQRKLGTVTYFGGFIIGCASVAFRWFEVRHIPMQNLFEVFLLLGALVYPISMLCLV